jgi:hypothetical protein
LPTQYNISQVVTLLTTGQFTASLEAQLQPTQMDASTLECTLRICAGLTLCDAAKSIGTSWSTFWLTIQLTADEARTISFVTSCSTPAYVAIRNFVIPGQGTGVATTTAVKTATSLLPANAVTSTVISVDTTTVTETTTETSTETEFATSTCAVKASTEISITSSETSESPSESTSEPAPYPTPDPPPSPATKEYWTVNVINRCSLQAVWAVIATQPHIAVDNMLFTHWNSAGLSILSDDANPTFFLVSGGQMCITSQNTAQQWCGYEAVAAHVTSNRDTLEIDCPTLASSSYMGATIPLNIRNNVPDGSTGCTYFAYQIGCEPGNFCLGKACENNQRENDYLVLQWPISGAPRLRVRQTNVGRTMWRVSIADPVFEGGAYSTWITRHQGDWLEIPYLLSTATSITLKASCHYY